MIKDGNKKVTPKIKAQDLLMDAISVKLGYWTHENLNGLTDGMTEREIKLVQEQMQKQADRIAKMFGFDKAWVS